MFDEEKKKESESSFWSRVSTLGGLAGDVAGTFPGLPNADGISGVGDLLSGAGKVMSFDESGKWDPNWGGAGDLINGAITLKEMGEDMGPAGAVIGGVAQAGFNGWEAKRSHDKMVNATDPTTRAGHEHNMWGSVGDGTLGALHAGLGSWCKPADAALSGFELAADSAGTVAGLFGDDAGFGAGDVMGGILDGAIADEDDAVTNRVQRAMGDSGVIGGAVVGGAVKMAGDAALAPFRITNDAFSAVINTAGNMVDDDDTRDQYLDMNEGMSDVLDAGGSLASSAIDGLESNGMLPAARDMMTAFGYYAD